MTKADDAFSNSMHGSCRFYIVFCCGSNGEMNPVLCSKFFNLLVFEPNFGMSETPSIKTHHVADIWFGMWNMTDKHHFSHGKSGHLWINSYVGRLSGEAIGPHK